MKGIEKFNSKNHRYITFVEEEDGYLIIHGKIGIRKYLYYSLKEAVTEYNKKAKNNRL